MKLFNNFIGILLILSILPAIGMKTTVKKKQVKVTQKIVGDLHQQIKSKLDSYFKPKQQEESRDLTEEEQNIIQQYTQEVIQKIQLPDYVQDQLIRIFSKIFIEEYQKELSQNWDSALNWCDCTSVRKRVLLALKLIQNIKQRYTDYSKPLVYTSFASGGLLQDYIILSELILTYKNLIVNFIDLEYPEVNMLARSYLDQYEVETESFDEPTQHNIYQANYERKADDITLFKTKIAQIISQYQKLQKKVSVDINIYSNAYQFINKVQSKATPKTDVLIMVDPNVGHFSAEPYPSQANVLNFWFGVYPRKPVLTLYYPRYNQMQLYVLKSVKNNPQVKNIISGIQNLVTQTTTNNRYSPKLLEALLKEEMPTKIAKKSITNLVEHFANLSKLEILERKNFEEFNAITKKNKKLLEDLENKPETTIITRINQEPVVLSWSSDPYISFQDMINTVINTNSVVYTLHLASWKSGHKIITKVNPSLYKKRDVITPLSGAMYSEEGYEKIKLEPQKQKLQNVSEKITPESVEQISEKEQIVEPSQEK